MVSNIFYPYLVKIWLEFFCFFNGRREFFFCGFPFRWLIIFYAYMWDADVKPQKLEKKPLGLWYALYFHCMAQGWRKLKPINSADGKKNWWFESRWFCWDPLMKGTGMNPKFPTSATKLSLVDKYNLPSLKTNIAPWKIGHSKRKRFDLPPWNHLG